MFRFIGGIGEGAALNGVISLRTLDFPTPFAPVTRKNVLTEVSRKPRLAAIRKSADD